MTEALQRVAELAGLPPRERIKRYLDLAADARQEAEVCNDRVRQSYLIMAEDWERRAATTAATLKPDEQPTKVSALASR